MLQHMEEDGVFGYIVTELCECNLDTFVCQLRKSGAVNQRLAMGVARDMLEGVHYLHQRGVQLGRLKVSVSAPVHMRVYPSDQLTSTKEMLHANGRTQHISGVVCK